MAEGAADYTCDVIKSNGGECTPEMRAGLVKAYQTGLDQLEKNLRHQATEPGCGDSQAAKDHGRLPMPCFSDYPGTEVRPATGSVQEPPIVTVRVTQVKPAPPFLMPACRITSLFQLSNHFSGGYLGGAMIKATDMTGYPFQVAEAVVPLSKMGQSRDVKLVFKAIQPFNVPGHKGIPQGMTQDWIYLYVGGTGPITARALTATPVPGAKASGRDQVLDCADQAQATVQIPKED